MRKLGPVQGQILLCHASGVGSVSGGTLLSCWYLLHSGTPAEKHVPIAVIKTRLNKLSPSANIGKSVLTGVQDIHSLSR